MAEIIELVQCPNCKLKSKGNLFIKRHGNYVCPLCSAISNEQKFLKIDREYLKEMNIQ